MEEQFQIVGRYQYSSEALIYKGKLESEGIQVFIRDNNIVDSNPLYSNAVGGIKLFVKSEDFEKAQLVLSDVSQYSLNENNQLIKCPKCNAEQVEMVTSIKDIRSFLAFLFSVLVVYMPFYSKHKYKCQSCKFEFN
ncbi:putative signal transducing protein [Flavobacterium koreense]